MEQRTTLTRKQLAEAVLAALSKTHTYGKRVGKPHTYRDVALQLYPAKDPNRIGALLWKIVNRPDYLPGKRACRELGIYEPIPTAPCEKCGEVHKVPWCTKEEGAPGIAPVCPICGEVHTVDFCTKDMTIAPAPVCPKCGHVHVSRRCTNGNRKNKPRIAIRLDSPKSAARSIIKHMNTERIAELIDLLTEL